ncbi:MAG: hypothetical protein ACYCZY_02950 [Lacisediminihabitans sp.]
MTVAGDDEALTWGDETDPTHVDAPTSTEVTEPEAVEGKAASSALLIVYGIFAGAYLLYAIGWIIAVQRNPVSFASLLPEIMYQLGEFLAIASPAIWFAAAFLLTRGRRPAIRILWLLLGALALVPWPLFLTV